ncbi:ANTAR domain-containing protein [Jatrophihabitans sp. DSM 45814]
MTQGTTGSNAADDDDLRNSLTGLSRLASGRGQRGLEEVLTHVAEFAVGAIPGADGAGLTLFQDDRPDTVVATADFVRDVDAIQYGLREGPCITAAAESRTVRSSSLGGDRAFPRFGPRAGRLGVHSVLSLPLLAETGTLGSMNVYAHARNAFDDRAVELGELFAVPAAISVQNAQALSQASRLAAHLQAALNGRAIIDQALGILMSRAGCTSEEAFERLRVISQTENRKSAVVAQSIVDEAVRRARARHSDD